MFQCVDILEKWQSSATATGVGGAETIAAVGELTGILTSYDMEALLLAHDSIVSYVDGLQRKQSPASAPPSGPPSPTSSWKDSRVIDNIKIIRIEKTNEPLGATVRNEGDAVIIGNNRTYVHQRFALTICSRDSSAFAILLRDGHLDNFSLFFLVSFRTCCTRRCGSQVGTLARGRRGSRGERSGNARQDRQ